MKSSTSPDRPGPSGRLSELFHSSSRHRLIIALACLGGALLLFLDQARREPVYEATSQVIVRGADLSSILQGGSSDQNTNRLVTTLAELVHSSEVLDEAASIGGLDADDRTRLDTDTRVETKIDSDVIDIATKWDSGDDAVRLANAVAQAFVAYRRQIEVGPLIAAERDLGRSIERLERTGGGNTLQSLVQARVDLRTRIELGGRNSIVVQAEEAVQVAPRPKLWAAIGGLLGLLGGVAAVSLLGRFRGRVRGADEVAASLDAPVLARVPTLAMSAPGAGPAVLQASPPPGTDAYWTLLAGLDLLDPDRRHRVMLVVGAMEDEGASTTAANLAGAAAKAGRSVVLCDFDLRQPAIGNVFGCSPYQTGVTSVLTGQATLDEALEAIPVVPVAPAPVAQSGGRGPSALGGLSILPSGPPIANPGGLASSAAVAQLVSALRDSASHVYIDCPPWLASGDALALARHADAILLVVRAGQTLPPQFEDMRRWLTQISTPVLGVVLNTASAPIEAEGSVVPARQDLEGAPLPG